MNSLQATYSQAASTLVEAFELLAKHIKATVSNVQQHDALGESTGLQGIMRFRSIPSKEHADPLSDQSNAIASWICGGSCLNRPETREIPASIASPLKELNMVLTTAMQAMAGPCS